MAIKIYEDASLVPSGMWMAQCNLCQKATWHYRPGKATAHCMNHSEWHPGMRHRTVPAIVQSGGMNKTRHEAPTEAQLRVMNRMDRSMYRSAENVTTQRNIGAFGWAKDIFADHELRLPNPDEVRCSHCGKITSHVEATRETKPRVRKRIEIYKDPSDGTVHQKETVSVVAERINACPSCSLEVRKAIPVRIV